VHLSKTWKNNIIDNNITENHGKGINLEESSNNTIDLNNVTKNGHGIYLDRSNFTTVKNNTIAEGEKAGIYLWSTVGSSMDNNTLLDNPIGIALEESSERNVLVRNNVTNSTEGINISGGSDENQIQQNRLRSCGIGVILAGAGRNVISGNEIADSLFGISLDLYSRGNSILGNDLSTNVEAAKDGGDNRWDDGSRGNYYGTGSCDDADGDGVCDGPRSIPGGGDGDRFPLSRPISI
ncbi:MAG: NosD domain-containing protein, partial [Methanothrix sp.]